MVNQSSSDSPSFSAQLVLGSQYVVTLDAINCGDFLQSSVTVPSRTPPLRCQQSRLRILELEPLRDLPSRGGNVLCS
jgi:hypothetical protein